MCFFLSLQHEQTRWTLLFSSALSPSGPAQWRTIGSRWYRKTPFDPPVDRSSGFSGGCFQPWPGNPEGRVMKLVIFVTLDKWARVYIPLTVKFNTCGAKRPVTVQFSLLFWFFNTGLTSKYYTRLKKLAKSSLFVLMVRDKENFFITLTPVSLLLRSASRFRRKEAHSLRRRTTYLWKKVDLLINLFVKK
jgi:hypothetical protein